MSNPGPASSTSIHPSNLATNQALRVIAMAKGVSVSALGDTPMPVINTSYWVPTTVVVSGATVDVSSVALGVYTATSGASGSGSAIRTTAALTSNTSSAFATVGAAASTSATQTAQTLYINQTTATAAGTVDVYVYGYDLSGPQV